MSIGTHYHQACIECATKLTPEELKRGVQKITREGVPDPKPGEMPLPGKALGVLCDRCVEAVGKGRS